MGRATQSRNARSGSALVAVFGLWARIGPKGRGSWFSAASHTAQSDLVLSHRCQAGLPLCPHLVHYCYFKSQTSHVSYKLRGLRFGLFASVLGACWYRRSCQEISCYRSLHNRTIVSTTFSWSDTVSAPIDLSESICFVLCEWGVGSLFSIALVWGAYSRSHRWHW